MAAAGSNPPDVSGGIGASVKRVDGMLKVTGEARYASDVPVRNAAYAYLHTSAIALGRIVEIDEREARALPGVLEILTWHNAAGQFAPVQISLLGGPARTSMMPLQSPEIRHDGEIVAVVVAETYETARDASNRLRIAYAPRTPTATFGMPGLVAEEAGRGNPRHENIRVGDAEAALAASSVTIDRRYSTSTQHQNPIELFTTTAEWVGDELTLHEPCNFMVGMQHGVAAQMKQDPAKVRVVSRFVGGSFGSKGGLTPRTALVALAARRLGRPVKLVATRDQAFTIATHRAETRHRVRLGAGRDGRLSALIHDSEETSSRPDSFRVAGADVTARMYACPSIASRSVVQHADRDTPGFMRAPAEVPYMFAMECAMDEMAEALGIDPVQLRKLNEPPIDPVAGIPFSSRSLVACYDVAAAAFGWSRRDPRPGSMGDADWQIGWGCASAVYPSFINASFARVTLSPDRALVEVAGHEIGTGAYTVYGQIAAEHLGLPFDRVEVRMGDSRLPPAPTAAGSCNAASIGNAVAIACAMVRDRLAAAAVVDGKSLLRGKEPASIRLAAAALHAADGTAEPLADALGRLGGVVEVLAGHEPGTVPSGSLAGLRSGRLGFGGGTLGKDFTRMAFGAEFVEVRVHRRTREIRVSRMVGAFAAGRILNPVTARSQLLGGMIWGVASALHEATEIDTRHARYTNDNLAEYLLAVNADIPEIDIRLVPETDRHVNALGIKGIGELGNVGTDAAVANAVHHATGKRIRELPIRIEDLLDV